MLKPLFKYPGGKASELKYISPLIPEHKVYIEPFVGGGAIYWSDNASKYIINDFASEVTAIYSLVKNQEPVFLNYFKQLSALWDCKQNSANKIELQLIDYLSNNNDVYKKIDFNSILKDEFNNSELWSEYHEIFTYELETIFNRKVQNLKRIQEKTLVTNLEENALGILGAAIYMTVRRIYNDTSIDEQPQLKTVLFFFLREYSYSSMFRYNSFGKFNVPFGGNSYAKKSLTSRYEQITAPNVISKLQNTQIKTGDFSDSIEDTDDTFIFLDPPYDSNFSTYNQKEFDKKEQIRLRDTLLTIKHAKWMIVIKNTEFISDLYSYDNWYKITFDKSYSVNFKNRNNQLTEHVIITNYQV